MRTNTFAMMIYGFSGLRFTISICRQPLKIGRGGVTIRKLGTPFGFSLSVSFQRVILFAQFEAVRRFAGKQTCEIPLNCMFLICAHSHPTAIYNLIETCCISLNVYPFSQRNQCFSVLDLCSQCCDATRCHCHADNKNVFLHPILILSLNLCHKNTKAIVQPLSYLFQKTLYLCNSSLS